MIIFNHPFFSENPIPNIPVTNAIFDPGDLIHRFLKEAPQYLNKGGYLIMPFFHFAGETNDPELQAPSHGYKVVLKHRVDVDDENIQKGLFSVYQIIPSAD